MSGRRPRARALGILGGTFNPPHLGHVAIARHAREELALERVLLVPADTAPNKSHRERVSDGEDPGPEHRLRMCELVVADLEGLGVCPTEVERGGVSYTVDTLRAIHASDPDASLTLIVGADTARTLDSWREPERLLELARIAVAARAGAPRPGVLDALAELDAGARGERGVSADRRAAGTAAKVRFLEMPEVAVSSSLVRERVGRGEPVEELVGAAVARYIDEHRLYRPGETVAA